MGKFNRNTEQNNKKPMQIKNYHRTCKTPQEAFDILCSAHQEIEEVIYPTIMDGDEAHKIDIDRENILVDMMKNILDYVQFKCPSPETMENMSISVNLKANKVQVKTDKYIGFGWYVKYTKDSRNSATIDEMDLMITLYGDRSIYESEQYLLSNGWEESNVGK